MNSYNYPSVKSVVVCGDIHGEFEKLVAHCWLMRDTLIIVAGDCGFGFNRTSFYISLYIRKLRRRLKMRNNYIVFIRGNHDNPECFTGRKFQWKHFRTVPDYSVITACGHNILCVGGAVSIDRDSRTEGKDWWMNEGPALRPDLMAEIASNGMRIDTVVTHTAPSFCECVTPPSYIKNAELLADLRHERDVMDGVLANLHHDGHPLKNWYYGHFHSSWNARIDGIDFTMLGIREMKELTYQTKDKN